MVELIGLVNLIIISSVVILNQLTMGGNALNCIPDCDPHIPALFNFFLASDPSFYSTSPPLGRSNHVIIPISTDFFHSFQIRGHKMGTLTRNGLMMSSVILLSILDTNLLSKWVKVL